MGQSLAIKIISYVFYALFAISIVLGVIFMINKNENILLIWTYALSIAAISSVILFAIANIFSSKKSMVTGLIVFAAFGLLLLVSYAIASDIIPIDAAGEVFDITASTSRWSGATLYMLYILLGLSFSSLIYTEIRSAFK